ncbi:hypothetical protein GCM10007891_24640 [Methylophaga thalassica]|uniref:Antirestriction protein ArdC n=1 Tax=Methylophaga thalassica TaxID=40223 RepID=A0ABQ5U1F9_9GAMM|nr:DUF3560 domain-containing protein [Methylophaga thalassica]GLQ00611.1 hypothetical protein GCM10007891_24640 [Methylophaga thalassica]
MNTNQQKANQSSQQKNKACGAELPQKQMVKSKKTYSKSEKSIQARQELRARSQEAKAIREGMIANAETVADQLKAAATTLNFIITGMYQAETECKEFKTFKDWKEAGYKVKKGVSGFPIWGTPKQITKKLETEEGEELHSDPQEFWPLCYLFNESQVEKADSKEPSNEDQAPAEAVEADNEPAPAEEQEEAPAVEPSHAESVENSPFVMADYQDRLEAKRDRLQERAENKRKESDAAYKRSHALVEHIPMGQPILVGHHSERAHRNALDKSWSLMGKSFKLGEYADSLESRAANVGTGGISSNDPEAITKLKEKLSSLEKSQDTMKAVNKIIRSKKLSDDEKADQIVKDGLLTEKQAREIIKPDFAGRIGFASYSLSNNNAEIRRTRERLEELERLHNSAPIDFENDDFSMSINNGQIIINFAGGKPNDETRQLVKRAAFKWSRYQGAWVRKVTGNAIYSARHLLESLKALEEMY